MATIDLNSEDIEAIAKRTVELLLVEVEHADSTPAGWMDSRMAAEYAATTMQSIHKATAERSIRFAQNGERGRVLRQWGRTSGAAMPIAPFPVRHQCPQSAELCATGSKGREGR